MLPRYSQAADSSGARRQPRLAIFGCGYVGLELARKARACDWSVVALTRNMDRARALQEIGADVVAADLASDDWHPCVTREHDFVVNCVSSGGGGLPGYWRSYVEGTRSILRWARPGLAATYVYTSSTSVYPQGGGELVTEESPTGGGSEAAEPLLAAEDLARQSAEFQRTFVLRLAGIYGPGRHYLLDQLRDGARLFPGTGAHRLNLIHRDDIVSAILACLLSPAAVAGGVYNVADGAPATKGEFASWLAARVGAPTPAFASDRGERPPGEVSPVRGRSGPVPDRIISNERLKAVLGWRPQFPDFRAGYDSILAGDTGEDPAGNPA